MKLSFNPPGVNPPCLVTFGERGVAVIRGSHDEAVVLSALGGIKAEDPAAFIEAAVATGKFTPSAWGSFPAVEYVESAPAPANESAPAPRKRRN